MSYPTDEVGNRFVSDMAIRESGVNPYTDILTAEEFYEKFGEPTHCFTGKNYIHEYIEACEGKAEILLGNDFSKIQGRFDTKLSLSSSDIDEVIKKRILDKNEESKTSLKMIYDKEESIIRNLLTFKSATYQKVYEDSNDFINSNYYKMYLLI